MTLKSILSVLLSITLSISATAQIKVAILPAADKTGDLKYAIKLLLSSSLTSAISMTEGYEAYDRIDLSSVLDEQSFQRTGMVSDSEIHKIGEMTGASFVLISEAAPLNDNNIITTAKIVNVESAKIESSAVGMMDISNPTQLLNDCKSLTDKLLNNTTDSRIQESVQSVPETITQISEVHNNVQLIKDNDQKNMNQQITTINGYEYVDLGLSVKWATVNVGADYPEDFGDYYAWGETETKSNYNRAIYKQSRKTIKAKYNRKKNKNTLDLIDDLVNDKWAGGWRIPTKKEFQELMDKCIWIWTTRNGVNGYIITSKRPGYTDCSIFLPAAGYRYGLLDVGTGTGGYYWSSSLNENMATPFAYLLEFGRKRNHLWSSLDNCCGLSVRPVCP